MKTKEVKIGEDLIILSERTAKQQWDLIEFLNNQDDDVQSVQWFAIACMVSDSIKNTVINLPKPKIWDFKLKKKIKTHLKYTPLYICNKVGLSELTALQNTVAELDGLDKKKSGAGRSPGRSVANGIISKNYQVKPEDVENLTVRTYNNLIEQYFNLLNLEIGDPKNFEFESDEERQRRSMKELEYILKNVQGDE